jgi:hypothetical protein
MAQRWQDKFALDPLLINDIQRPHVAGGERAVTASAAPVERAGDAGGNVNDRSRKNEAPYARLIGGDAFVLFARAAKAFDLVVHRDRSG